MGQIGDDFLWIGRLSLCMRITRWHDQYLQVTMFDLTGEKTTHNVVTNNHILMILFVKLNYFNSALLWMEYVSYPGKQHKQKNTENTKIDNL